MKRREKKKKKKKRSKKGKVAEMDFLVYYFFFLWVKPARAASDRRENRQNDRQFAVEVRIH